MLEFPLHAHGAAQSPRPCPLHEPLDAFNRRHFDRMLSAVRFRANSSITRRRNGDSTMWAIKFSPPSSRHPLRASSPGCAGGHDQRQLVLQYFRARSCASARHKRKPHRVQTVVQDFVWNIGNMRCTRTARPDASPEIRQRRKQRMDGALIHTERKLAALQPFQFTGAPFLTSSRR